MKNVEHWRASKYVMQGNLLRASRRREDVSVSSRLITDLIAERYQAALPQHCKGDLLDLGCGKAPLFIIYRYWASSITCTDWSSSPHNVSHADVLCDLNEPVPLPNESFDTIILSDVLEHLYRPQLLFHEVARMLRPGGKLIMNVPFMYWLHEQPHDYFRYTRFALERFAEDSHLQIVEPTELGGAFEVLADLVAKISIRMRFGGATMASMAQGGARWLGNTAIGRRATSATAQQIPLGYFMVAQVPPTA